MFVSTPALVNRHANHILLRHVILSSVTCMALPYFSTLFHNRTDFREKKIFTDLKQVFFCLKHFSIQNPARHYQCTYVPTQNTRHSHQILTQLEFLDRFSNNTRISIFMKIRPVETELFYADRRPNMTKLICAFRSPEKSA